MNAKTNTEAIEKTSAEWTAGAAPATTTSDVRAQALANNKAAEQTAAIQALPVEKQRDILLEACQAYMARHGANQTITEDPAYSSIVHAVRVVQVAKG